MDGWMDGWLDGWRTDGLKDECMDHDHKILLLKYVMYLYITIVETLGE